MNNAKFVDIQPDKESIYKSLALNDPTHEGHSKISVHTLKIYSCAVYIGSTMS